MEMGNIVTRIVRRVLSILTGRRQEGLASPIDETWRASGGLTTIAMEEFLSLLKLGAVMFESGTIGLQTCGQYSVLNLEHL